MNRSSWLPACAYAFALPWLLACAPAAPAESPPPATPATPPPPVADADAPTDAGSSDGQVPTSEPPPDEPLPMACSAVTCMNGQDGCTEAKCMTPQGGGSTVCEYRAKFTGSCRCVAGDKRPCTTGGGNPGWKQCQPTTPNPSNTNTYWGTCS